MHRHTSYHSATGAALAIVTAASLLFAVSCSAPRDNSLDPASPNYNPGGHSNPDHPTEFNISVRTTHQAGDIASEAIYFVETIAAVTDLDGIAEVQIEIADSFRFKMVRQPNGAYFNVFYPGNYGHTIFDFVGAPIYIYVYDNLGHVSRSERQGIVRVLEQTPQITDPDPNTGPTLIPTPVLKWREDTSPFPITYTVSIQRDIGPTTRVTVYEHTGIPRVSAQGDTVDSFRVTQPIPARSGIYLLFVSTVDVYHNKSTSSGVGFFVH